MSLRRAIGLVALVLAPGCAFVRGYASGRSDEMAARERRAPAGFYRLVFEDFHGLDTDAMERNAVPWKVLTAALLLDARTRDPSLPLTEDAAIALVERRYGFLVPRRIANWPAGDPQPTFRRPLGLVRGVVRRSLPAIELEVVNTGCSTCHAGTTYDGDGNPTLEAWIGLPSTSIDLGRYADEVFVAFRAACARPAELQGAIRVMFPGASQTELDTIRKHYLPPLSDRIAKLAATIGGFTPYSNGSPGLTNGVATAKLTFGLLRPDLPAPHEVAFVSMPDLSPLRWKRSLLVDGVYAPPGWAHTGARTQPASAAELDALAGVAVFVTVNTLGVNPRVAAEQNTPLMRDVVAWAATLYEPPRFPGAIDDARARAGAGVYARACASCHGEVRRDADGRYRLISFPNRFVAADVIDTDATRAAAVDADVGRIVTSTALGRQMQARRSGAYLATPLAGVWATAPYLHDGSVPTLWHLMRPSERPARFEVGGHKLDLRRVGIAGDVAADGVYRYPRGYVPWMIPEVLDARAPGRGNGGHESPFDELSESDKDALLELLKVL